jgi:hypothetical protein
MMSPGIAQMVGVPDETTIERMFIDCDSLLTGKFACHLKTHHGFERMRLRGLSDARDEFHLVAIVQNLKTLANYIWRPSANMSVSCVA